MTYYLVSKLFLVPFVLELCTFVLLYCDFWSRLLQCISIFCKVSTFRVYGCYSVIFPVCLGIHPLPGFFLVLQYHSFLLIQNLLVITSTFSSSHVLPYLNTSFLNFPPVSFSLILIWPAPLSFTSSHA